jgi:hypothetical protein
MTRLKTVRFNFVHYVSILSVHKIHKPDKIMFHCDVIPRDSWWLKANHDFNLTVVHHQPRKDIFGKKSQHIEHIADVARLEVLLKYGGIYIDCDVIIVRPLHVFRQYSATIGKSREYIFSASTIISEPNSTFIRMWYDTYKRNFKPKEWFYNSGIVPYKLYMKHPDLIHVVNEHFSRPAGLDLPYMVHHVIDWSYFYTLHLTSFDDKYNPKNIKRANSTVGEILRYIYYGRKQFVQ